MIFKKNVEFCEKTFCEKNFVGATLAVALRADTQVCPYEINNQIIPQKAGSFEPAFFCRHFF